MSFGFVMVGVCSPGGAAEVAGHRMSDFWSWVTPRVQSLQRLGAQRAPHNVLLPTAWYM